MSHKDQGEPAEAAETDGTRLGGKLENDGHTGFLWKEDGFHFQFRKNVIWGPWGLGDFRTEGPLKMSTSGHFILQFFLKEHEICV